MPSRKDRPRNNEICTTRCHNLVFPSQRTFRVYLLSIAYLECFIKILLAHGCTNRSKSFGSRSLICCKLLIVIPSVSTSPGCTWHTHTHLLAPDLWTRVDAIAILFPILLVEYGKENADRMNSELHSDVCVKVVRSILTLGS